MLTDDDLDRHLKDILLACSGSPASTAGRDRLRLAIDAAVQAKHEECLDAAVNVRLLALEEAARIADDERAGLLAWKKTCTGDDAASYRDCAVTARQIAAAIRERGRTTP